VRIARYTYTANVAGNSPVFQVNYTQPTFNVALAVIPSAAATGLSCSAQFTMDDQSILRPVNWTQTTTTVTITDGTYAVGSSTFSNPHGLITGDSVTITGTSSSNLVGFDGTYNVTVTSPTAYTITVVPSQTAQGQGFVIPQRWLVTTIVPAATATRLYANTTQPATAFRFVVAALTAGTVDFIVLQGLGS
jgi:hypothetical protein